MSNYRHPKWQKKRLEVLQRDDFTCQKCGDAETELHVHHRTYHRGRKVWETPIDDLVTLCKPCHKAVEQAVREARESVTGGEAKAHEGLDDMRLAMVEGFKKALAHHHEQPVRFADDFEFWGAARAWRLDELSIGDWAQNQETITQDDAHLISDRVKYQELIGQLANAVISRIPELADFSRPHPGVESAVQDFRWCLLMITYDEFRYEAIISGELFARPGTPFEHTYQLVAQNIYSAAEDLELELTGETRRTISQGVATVMEVVTCYEPVQLAIQYAFKRLLHEEGS